MKRFILLLLLASLCLADFSATSSDYAACACSDIQSTIAITNLGAPEIFELETSGDAASWVTLAPSGTFIIGQEIITQHINVPCDAEGIYDLETQIKADNRKVLRQQLHISKCDNIVVTAPKNIPDCSTLYNLTLENPLTFRETYTVSLGNASRALQLLPGEQKHLSLPIVGADPELIVHAHKNSLSKRFPINKSICTPIPDLELCSGQVRSFDFPATTTDKDWARVNGSHVILNPHETGNFTLEVSLGEDSVTRKVMVNNCETSIHLQDYELTKGNNSLPVTINTPLERDITIHAPAWVTPREFTIQNSTTMNLTAYVNDSVSYGTYPITVTFDDFSAQSEMEYKNKYLLPLLFILLLLLIIIFLIIWKIGSTRREESKEKGYAEETKDTEIKETKHKAKEETKEETKEKKPWKKIAIPILIVLLLLVLATMINDKVIKTDCAFTWDKGESFQVNLSEHFNDPDGDKLFYRVDGEPVSMNYTLDDSIVTLDPSANFTGIDYIEFVADDRKGGRVSSGAVKLCVEEPKETGFSVLSFLDIYKYYILTGFIILIILIILLNMKD
ncbi:MAG: hypothetical protein R6V53_00235 [Candidatus Woesearchaeota archaeon]